MQTELTAEKPIVVEPEKPETTPAISEAEKQPPLALPQPDQNGKKQKQELFSGLKPLFELSKSKEFDNQQLAAMIKEWAEKNGCSQENLEQTLIFLKKAETIIDNQFRPEQKVEIACALAELVLNGVFDADTLCELVDKVKFGGSSSTFDKVCEYKPNSATIIIYSELFESFQGVKQNITHTLKHEVAHGVYAFTEIQNDQELKEKITQLSTDGSDLQSRDSYRIQSAFSEFSQESEEGKTAKSAWLAKEIMAEKIACYLQSNGKFSEYINAVWSTTSAENQRKLMTDKKTLDLWIEENRFFFEKLKLHIADKAKMKDQITSARKKTDEEFLDQDYEGGFDDFSSGFYEPAMPDNSHSPSRSSSDNLWQALAGVAQSFSADIEPVVPVTELLGKSG